MAELTMCVGCPARALCRDNGRCLRRAWAHDALAGPGAVPPAGRPRAGARNTIQPPGQRQLFSAFMARFHDAS